MCNRVLIHNLSDSESKIDKYKSNWGSLLEYVDVSMPIKVSKAISSTIQKSFKSIPQKEDMAKVRKRPQTASFSCRRPTYNKSNIYIPQKHRKCSFKENISFKTFEEGNYPLYSAVYKLESKDNLTGFTKRCIFKTATRLSSALIRNKESIGFEKFPVSSLNYRGKKKSVNISKRRTEEEELNKWVSSKTSKEVLQDNQVIEFAKNMFLLWDSEGKGSFSVEKITEELISLGLTIDNKVIISLLESFKSKKEKKVENVSLDNFLRFMRGDKVSMHISKVLHNLIEHKLNYEHPYSISITKPSTAIIAKKYLKRNISSLHKRKDVSKRPVTAYQWDTRIDNRPFSAHRPLTAEKQRSCIRMNLTEKGKMNKTIEAIRMIESWWMEIEKKAEYKEDIPINVAADVLVSKGIGGSRNKVKQWLGCSVEHNKKCVTYSEFKNLLYKGVFRNAIKYIYEEIREDARKNGKDLPEFMKMSNYKTKLLTTAFDTNNPQYQEGMKIFDRLKRRYENISKPTKKRMELSKEDPYIDTKFIDKRSIDIMKQHKRVVTVHSELEYYQ